jgi:large conductance mechanosensitive channel
MKNFLQDFRAFALRGNVVELAIAVVIGGAFGKIVTSLVENMLMPVFGLLQGGVDFTDKTLVIGNVTIAYGKFIQSVIDFLIIAFIIFIAIRLLSRFKRKAQPATPNEEVLLLREIRDSLKK